MLTRFERHYLYARIQECFFFGGESPVNFLGFNRKKYLFLLFSALHSLDKNLKNISFSGVIFISQIQHTAMKTPNIFVLIKTLFYVNTKYLLPFLFCSLKYRNFFSSPTCELVLA